MPWVGAVVGAVGLAVDVAGKIGQADAQAKAAEFDAAKAAQNATLSRAQAAEDERVFRVGLRKTIGQARANVGASGLQFSGSVEDVIAESAAQGELDALKLRHAGEVRAAGFQSDVTLDNMRARAYGPAGTLSAAGALLKGGSDLAYRYGGTGSSSSSYGASGDFNVGGGGSYA